MSSSSKKRRLFVAKNKARLKRPSVLKTLFWILKLAYWLIRIWAIFKGGHGHPDHT